MRILRNGSDHGIIRSGSPADMTAYVLTANSEDFLS